MAKSEDVSAIGGTPLHTSFRLSHLGASFDTLVLGGSHCSIRQECDYVQEICRRFWIARRSSGR
jgi:hypothetical protein